MGNRPLTRKAAVPKFGVPAAEPIKQPAKTRKAVPKFGDWDESTHDGNFSSWFTNLSEQKLDPVPAAEPIKQPAKTLKDASPKFGDWDESTHDGNFSSWFTNLSGQKLDPVPAAEPIKQPAKTLKDARPKFGVLGAEPIKQPAKTLEAAVTKFGVPGAEPIKQPAKTLKAALPKFGDWDEDESTHDGNFSSWFTNLSGNLTTRISRVLKTGKRKKDSTSKENSTLEESYINTKLLELNHQKQSSLIVFSLFKLELATHYFTRGKLGVGGFGNVYKGYLTDHMARKISKIAGHAENQERVGIAVKKLETVSKQGFQQWLTEITTLGGVSHPNIVKLLGYCHENRNFLIVYEFMIKGSLNFYLFRKDSKYLLTWETRLKIMIGMARGLAYLHTMEDPIIHRDFKSSNILLDENYNAKISDFGLAHRRSMPLTEEEGVVMGTKGYAAPEYLESGKLDVKSDVHGFGVVLIEMLTGSRAVDKKRPVEQRNLLSWIGPKLSKRKELLRTMDSRLQGKYAFKEARKIAELALRCVSPYKSRPSIMEVVDRLQCIGASYNIT